MASTSPSIVNSCAIISASTPNFFKVPAVIGPISFLGLIVPHIARLLVGSNHKVLMPYTMILGAFTFLLADTIGRTICYPYEINATVIMSVVGGPFFVFLLRRSDRKHG